MIPTFIVQPDCQSAIEKETMAEQTGITTSDAAPDLYRKLMSSKRIIHLSPELQRLVTPGEELKESELRFVKEIGCVIGLNPLKLRWVEATPEDEWEKLQPQYRRIVAYPVAIPVRQNDS